MKTIARLLIIVSALAAQSAFAVSHSWTGASSALWSNANNWSPVAVPANGDTLVFPTGAANRTMTNDLVDQYICI